MIGWVKRMHFVFGIDYVPLCMLTTAEQLWLQFILLIIASLCISATVVYFPRHTKVMIKRMYYYYSGEEIAF